MKLEVIRVGRGYAITQVGQPYYGSDEHSVFQTRAEAERHARRRMACENEPAHDRELHEALWTTPGARTERQRELVARAERER